MPGRTLTVIRHQGDWTEVRFQDRQFGDRNGWIQSSRVRLHEETTVAAGAGGHDGVAVVTSVAPVYLHPEVMQEPLRVVAAAGTLTVVHHQGTWTEVRFKDPQFGERDAWIQRSDIRISELTTSRASAQETAAPPPRTSRPSPAPNVATAAVPGSLLATPPPSYQPRPRPVVPYVIPPSNTPKTSSTPAPVPPYMIPLLAVRNGPLTPVAPSMIPLLAVTSIAQSEEITLYGRDASAVAYIAEDLTVYLWSGAPVAYLERDDAGGFQITVSTDSTWAGTCRASCATTEAMRSAGERRSSHRL